MTMVVQDLFSTVMDKEIIPTMELECPINPTNGLMQSLSLCDL